MQPAKTPKQTVIIPVQLAQFVLNNKFVNPFKVFIAAKMVTPGRFKTHDACFQALCKASGLKSRTVIKHLLYLQKINWVGYDQSNKTFYIRSMSWLRQNECFYERHAIKATITDLPNFQALLASAIICLKITRQKHYISQTERSHGYKRFSFWKPIKSAVLKGNAASQDFKGIPPLSMRLPPYLGYSNAAIAQMLNLKQTRACVIKQEAEKAGYLKTKPHFQHIAQSFSPVLNWRKTYIESGFPDYHKIRVRTCRQNGRKIYQLVIQMHDEIIPLIKIRKINFLQKAKQARKRSITPIKVSRTIAA